MEKTYLVNVRNDDGETEECAARLTQEQLAVLEWLKEWDAITSYQIIEELPISNLISEEYCTKVNKRLYEIRDFKRERGAI